MRTARTAGMRLAASATTSSAAATPAKVARLVRLTSKSSVSSRRVKARAATRPAGDADDGDPDGLAQDRRARCRRAGRRRPAAPRIATRALRDGIGQQAVDPNQREQQGRSGEKPHEPGGQVPLPVGAPQHVGHQADVLDRLLAINLQHRAPDCRHRRQRVGAGAHGQGKPLAAGRRSRADRTAARRRRSARSGGRRRRRPRSRRSRRR